MSNSSHSDKLIELDEKTRQSQKKGLPSFFYFFPLLHLIIVLPLAYYLNIWADEASTLFTTENGFFQTFQNTFQDEKQAPLYFLILSLWREISSSIFFARLFSIICSLFAIGVFYDLVRRLWNEKTAMFATFFFALHPLVVWASLEIRNYSLIMLLTLALTKFFFGGYLDRRKTDSTNRKKITRSKILFIIVATASIYTNYYLGFILVGFFVVLLVLQRQKTAARYFLHMAIVGVAILPLVWLLKAQFDVHVDGYHQKTYAIEGMKLLWNHSLSFFLPTELHPPENQTIASYIRVWFVRFLSLGIAAVLVLRRRVFADRILIFGTTTLICFAFLYLIYFLLGPIYVEIRHASFVFPVFCLLVVAIFSEIFSVDKIGSKKRSCLVGALALLLTVSYSYALFSLHPNLTKRGDWSRVGDFIEENETPEQPIIVFSNYEALALPYYYEGKNGILPNENFFKWKYEDEFGAETMWTKQIAYLISIIPKDAKEIWLVTEDICQTTKGCLPLEKFVGANYTIVKDREFYKERVRLLRKK